MILPWRLDSQQVFSTGLSHSVAQVLSFRQKLWSVDTLGDKERLRLASPGAIEGSFLE